MNLESFGVLLLFACLHGNVLADNNEVKRGKYPFMAFLYFPDKTVVDSTGLRYVRSAVLIKLDVLISSAIDDSIFDKAAIGFPQKTLMVRAGAISRDISFTFFADEYEQEQEVVQIIRPVDHDVLVWWRTDITVLRTLLPFEKTLSVGIADLHFEEQTIVKNCQILVYAVNNVTDSSNRYLMELPVNVLSMPNNNNCGPNIHPDTMICSVDATDNSNSNNYPDFCHTNGGGPLICSDEIIGLQTYINNDCKQPHLYQNLYVRYKFISCATENKCHNHECSDVCYATNKDTLENSKTLSNQSGSTNISQPAVNASSTTSKPIDDLETFPKASAQEKYEKVDFFSDVANSDVTSIKSVENKYEEIKLEMKTNVQNEIRSTYNVEIEESEESTKKVETEETEVLLIKKAEIEEPEVTNKNIEIEEAALTTTTSEAKNDRPIIEKHNTEKHFTVQTTKRSINQQNSILVNVESTTSTQAKGLRVETDSNVSKNQKANHVPQIGESRRADAAGATAPATAGGAPAATKASDAKMYTGQIFNLVFCLVLII